MENYTTNYKCDLCRYPTTSLSKIKRHVEIPRKELQLPVNSVFKHRTSSESKLIIGYVNEFLSWWNHDHFQEAFRVVSFVGGKYDEWDYSLEEEIRENQEKLSSPQQIHNFLFKDHFQELSNDELNYALEGLKKANPPLSKSPLIRGKIPKVGDLYKTVRL